MRATIAGLVRLHKSTYIYRVAQYDNHGRVRIEPAQPIPAHLNRSGWHHESWLTPCNAV